MRRIKGHTLCIGEGDRGDIVIAQITHPEIEIRCKGSCVHIDTPDRIEVDPCVDNALLPVILRTLPDDIACTYLVRLINKIRVADCYQLQRQGVQMSVPELAEASL